MHFKKIAAFCVLTWFAHYQILISTTTLINWRQTTSVLDSLRKRSKYSIWKAFRGRVFLPLLTLYLRLDSLNYMFWAVECLKSCNYRWPIVSLSFFLSLVLSLFLFTIWLITNVHIPLFPQIHVAIHIKRLMEEALFQYNSFSVSSTLNQHNLFRFGK